MAFYFILFFSFIGPLICLKGFMISVIRELWIFERGNFNQKQSYFAPLKIVVLPGSSKENLGFHHSHGKGMIFLTF